MNVITAFKLGDKVVVSPEVASPDGEIYEIIEVPIGRNRVNYRAKNIRTGSVTRGRFECFILADNNDVAQVAFVPFVKHLQVGDIVKATGARWGKSQGDIFVVISAKRNEQYRVAKLGGDEGRYYDNIPRAMLEEAKIEWTVK
jgi:hypothetical protein